MSGVYPVVSWSDSVCLSCSCQFVVADRGDYSIHTSDPDLLVDWDSIELVVSASPSLSLSSFFLPHSTFDSVMFTHFSSGSSATRFHLVPSVSTHHVQV